MANIIKVLRSLTAGIRPSGHTYGEPYVNFSDNQFGILDSGNTPRDLIGVPFFSPSTTYSSGQPVNYQGQLFVANMNIVAGAWNPLQWNLITSRVKNYIINGAMMFSQQNGSNAVTTNNSYPVDMFTFYFGTGTFTGQQVQVTTPGGSYYRLRWTINTASSLGVSDFLMIQQSIEGYRMSDLLFGSAAAKTITVQFGFKGPAGNYALSCRTVSGNRSYIVPFTISSGQANIDQRIAITIPPDQTGSWPIGNVASMTVSWVCFCGVNYQGTPNTWQNGNLIWPTGVTGVNVPGSVFELFDVGLYVGTVAPVFQVPDSTTEWTACLRYYFNAYLQGTGFRLNTHPAGTFSVPLTWPCVMRVAPTFTAAWGGAVRSSDGQYGFSSTSGPTYANYYPSNNADISQFGGTIGFAMPTTIPTTFDRPQAVSVLLDGSARM
jgi:hypothetical protein